MRIGHLVIVLIISAFFSVVAPAQDQPLGYGINATRIYSSEEGPETVVVTASPSGPNMKLHLFIFRNTEDFEFIKLLTSAARPEMVDVYWNKTTERYVITWLAKKASLYFALFDPLTGKVETKKIALKSKDTGTKKQLSSAHTAFNYKRDVYAAFVTDGSVLTYIEINNDSLEILESKQLQWTKEGSLGGLSFGDVVYARDYDSYYGVLIDPINSELLSFQLGAAKSGVYKLGKGRTYINDGVPSVEVQAFPREGLGDDIYFAYLKNDPFSNEHDILSNRISKVGKSSKRFTEYHLFSDAQFGLGGVNHDGKRIYYIAYEQSYFFVDYGLQPAFKLYSVGNNGRWANGASGKLMRRAPYGVTNTGAASIDGEVVTFYTRNNRTYYFFDKAFGKTVLSVPSVEIAGVESYVEKLDDFNYNGFEISFDISDVNLNSVHTGQIISIHNANGPHIPDRTNGGRILLQVFGKQSALSGATLGRIILSVTLDKNRNGYLDGTHESTGLTVDDIDWKQKNSIRIRVEVEAGGTLTIIWVNGEKKDYRRNTYSTYWNPAPVFSVGGYLDHGYWVPPNGAKITNILIRNMD